MIKHLFIFYRNMKTTLKTLILNCLLASCFITVHGQDFYASQRASWLQKAKESIPQLTVTEKKPVGLVHIIKDENAFQQYKAEQTAPINLLRRQKPSLSISEST